MLRLSITLSVTSEVRVDHFQGLGLGVKVWVERQGAEVVDHFVDDL